MNKEHLAKLQQKVNRLMRASSEDSESENAIEIDSHNKHFSFNKETQPETVRKCIDLIKQNKQLKIVLEREMNKTAQLRKQLQKQRSQKHEQRLLKQQRKKEEYKLAQNQKQEVRKLAKVEAELEQSKRKNEMLQKLLMNERKKNRTLCKLINKNIPELQYSLDRVTANLDAKMEAHFSKIYNN